MPPPGYGKTSTRSKYDLEREGDVDLNNSKSNFSNSNESKSDEDLKISSRKCEGVGIVKTLLGPSFEGAVLKTLEFGKSLIQKNETNNKTQIKEKKIYKEVKKDAICEKMHNQLIMRSKDKTGDQFVKTNMKKCADGRLTRKRIVFTAKFDNKQPNSKTIKKLSSVSKIRSLDSDLKQEAPSPEKIKRQLEALIQINKDEPPEHAGNNIPPLKSSKIQDEVTLLPTFFAYNTETDINYSSSFEATSRRKCSIMNEGENSSSVQEISASAEYPRRKIWHKTHAKLCQAPEFLSNALGPTLDVSLAENINMIRNLLNRGGTGRGEGEMEPESQAPRSESISEDYRIRNDLKVKKKPCVPCVEKEELTVTRIDKIEKIDKYTKIDKFEPKESEDQMQCKISELKTRVEELQLKEQCLVRQIEEEERERECRRKAFEEEEKKLCSMKACLEGLLEEEKRKECSKKTSAISDSKDFEAHYERIKQRIASEEEKLSKVKNQYDSYKRELTEARHKKEALKRNKSLLDAWDVIASRVCHTKLPSFSRAHDLERKHLRVNENPANIHCCFLSQINELDARGSQGCEIRSKSRCSSRSESHSACGVQSTTEIYRSKIPEIKYEGKKQELIFPIQRDITCGLHPSMKSCNCGNATKTEKTTWSSEDELLKKTLYPPKRNTPICRSRSEATIEKVKGAKIVKVLWAITRINIFQNNCRTYEVMDATSTPPPIAPAKTEGIFVVKGQSRKPYGSPYLTSRTPRKHDGGQIIF